MKKISFLEKLLDGVDVEWKKLGEMTEISTGNSNRQDANEDGVYPFYVRSKNILKSNTFQFDETAIIIPGEGGIGDIFHYAQGKYALHQRAYRVHVVSGNLDTKYLYHFMSSNFKKYILMKSVGATSISIRKPMLKDFPIPIPCPNNPEKSLRIQRKIVRILDTFTELTAELTAERNLRNQQYQYYRDQLLNFKEGERHPYVEKLLDGSEVEWKPLREVTLGTRNIKWQDADKISYQYIDLTSVSIETNKIIKTSIITPHNAPSRAKKIIEKNDVIFATTRPTQMRYCLINEEYDGEIASTGYCILRAKKNVLPKWILYLISSNEFKMFLEENQSGSAYPAISDTKVKDFKIPIPCPNNPEKSLAIQQEIVRILDKFDTLTHSISEGLPREIELRQKQYEYYRDLLLNFPKSEKGAA